MDYLRKNTCYIYILLWMVYNLQEMLMITGTLARLVLALLMSFTFYTFYEVNVHYKICPYLKWVNVMLLVFTVYGIIPVIGGWTLIGNWHMESTRSYVYLQNIYMSILPIYTFYYFTLRRQINGDNVTYIFVAFFVYSVLSFYQRYVLASEQSGMEEITNNMGYYFVPLIPMLYLVKLREWVKYVFLMIIIAYIMMAMKRGAILVGMIMLLLFMYHQFNKISTKHAVYLCMLSCAVSLAAYRFTSNLYDSSSYFKGRVEQTKSGDASQRYEIYSRCYNHFVNKTTPGEFLIGNGANATIVLLGEYAHNDWLEIAVNQGVVGLALYLVYWIVMFMEWKKYHGPTYSRYALGSVTIAYFLISLFSMSIDNMPTAATLCIGYCLAVSTRQKQIEECLVYT